MSYQYPTARFFVGNSFQATNLNMQDIPPNSVQGNATTVPGFFMTSLKAGTVVKILITQNPGSYSYSYTLDNQTTFSEKLPNLIAFNEMSAQNLASFKDSGDYTYGNTTFSATIIDSTHVLLNKTTSRSMKVVQPSYLKRFSAVSAPQNLQNALDTGNIYDITVLVLTSAEGSKTYKTSFRKSDQSSGGDPVTTTSWPIPFEGLSEYTKTIYSSASRGNYIYKNLSFTCTATPTQIYFRISTSKGTKMSSVRYTSGTVFGAPTPVNHSLDSYMSSITPFIGSLANQS